MGVKRVNSVVGLCFSVHRGDYRQPSIMRLGLSGEILSSGSLRYAFLEEPVSLLDLLPLKVDWLVEDYKCLCLMRFKFALNGYYLM